MATFAGPNIVTNGLVLALDAGTERSFKGEPTTNLLSNPTNEVIGTSSEFLQYADLAPIFNTYGTAVTYSLSLDLKSQIAGNILVYMQNGSSSKYTFINSVVTAETSYKRFYFNGLTAAIYNSGETLAILAFYGTYGSGRIPSVKNVQVEIKNTATPFVNGTRGLTPATGGGWWDLSGNANNGTLSATTTYTSNNNGCLVFDGVEANVEFSSLSIPTGLTISVWCKRTGTLNSFAPLVEQGGASRNFRLVTYSTYIAFGNDTVVDNFYRTTSSFTTLNIWYNYVAIYDGSYKIYVNGTSQSVTQQTGSYGYWGTDKLRIGYRPYSASVSAYNGYIASVKIYSKVLTPTEILQEFNALKSRFGL